MEPAVPDQILNSLADCLTPDVAQRILAVKLPEDVQSRLDELASKAGAGTLSLDERTEYERSIDRVDLLAIIKAMARSKLAK